MVRNQSTQVENQRNIQSMYTWRLSRHQAEKRQAEIKRVITRQQHAG